MGELWGVYENFFTKLTVNIIAVSHCMFQVNGCWQQTTCMTVMPAGAGCPRRTMNGISRRSLWWTLHNSDCTSAPRPSGDAKWPSSTRGPSSAGERWFLWKMCRKERCIKGKSFQLWCFEYLILIWIIDYRSAFLQVMARRLLGAKPLPEAMLAYCQLGP